MQCDGIELDQGAAFRRAEEPSEVGRGGKGSAPSSPEGSRNRAQSGELFQLSRFEVENADRGLLPAERGSIGRRHGFSEKLRRGNADRKRALDLSVRASGRGSGGHGPRPPRCGRRTGRKQVETPGSSSSRMTASSRPLAPSKRTTRSAPRSRTIRRHSVGLMEKKGRVPSPPITSVRCSFLAPSSKSKIEIWLFSTSETEDSKSIRRHEQAFGGPWLARRMCRSRGERPSRGRRRSAIRSRTSPGASHRRTKTRGSGKTPRARGVGSGFERA